MKVKFLPLSLESTLNSIEKEGKLNQLCSGSFARFYPPFILLPQILSSRENEIICRGNSITMFLGGRGNMRKRLTKPSSLKTGGTFELF